MDQHPDIATMQKRAQLARHAIRNGADPYLALLLVIAPPATPEQAMELLRPAA